MLNTFPSPTELKGAVLGTVTYLSLYSAFITFQSLTKFYLVAQKQKEVTNKEGQRKVSLNNVKYYNKDDKLALLGDRTVGNFGEMALLFLPLLWIHALFVDPTQSFSICMFYVGSRALYPMVFGRGMILLFSTVPGYLVVVYLFFQILYHVVL